GEAARVARVAVRLLLLELLTREGHLLGVDDDDEVTHVHVRSKGGLVLATEDGGGVARETAEHDVFGVDDDPLALHIRRRGAERTRHEMTQFWSVMFVNP